MTRAYIRFLRRGEIVTLSDVPPTRTLLDYLRLEERARGTKEGCNEGDCGACTVALGTLRDGKLSYEAVNSCILLLGQIDGKELVTVDDLASDGKLHPVQQAMVDHHASQCGFCTPGFIMSLFTLYHAGQAADRQGTVNHIAGNLCRCTGYRPILDAALASCQGKAEDLWATRASETVKALTALADGTDIFVEHATGFYAAPASAESLTALAVVNPDATLVAGATDVGLWITKQMRPLKKIIQLSRVPELQRVDDRPDRLILGAAVTYDQAFTAIAGIDADLGELLRRIGSKQVRTSGTIGGNIANGSPIGDTPPALIALDAEITLRYGATTRKLKLEDFFIDYGKQDRQPGELVWQLEIPKLSTGEIFRCYKISKRFDQDISAVMGAFKFRLENRGITATRIVYGGMAAIPKRGKATEAALTGISLDEAESWAPAIAALAEDFRPLSDMRASADYRLTAAQALMRKALMEVAGLATTDSRIVGQRETAARVA